MIDIYAATGTVSDVTTYYQHTYPQYRLYENCCTSATKAQLTGQDGWACVVAFTLRAFAVVIDAT